MASEIQSRRRRIDARVFSEEGVQHQPPELSADDLWRGSALSEEFSDLKAYLKTCLNESENRSQTTYENVNRKVSGLEKKVELLALRMKEVADVQSRRIRELAQGINQKSIAETRIEEVIEKHNQTINSFEVKMRQMQKVIEDQEIKLIHANEKLRQAVAALEKARRL